MAKKNIAITALDFPVTLSDARQIASDFNQGKENSYWGLDQDGEVDPALFNEKFASWAGPFQKMLIIARAWMNESEIERANVLIDYITKNKPE